jgi:hypothetical protein
LILTVLISPFLHRNSGNLETIGGFFFIRFFCPNQTLWQSSDFSDTTTIDRSISIQQTSGVFSLLADNFLGLVSLR